MGRQGQEARLRNKSQPDTTEGFASRPFHRSQSATRSAKRVPWTRCKRKASQNMVEILCFEADSVRGLRLGSQRQALLTKFEGKKSKIFGIALGRCPWNARSVDARGASRLLGRGKRPRTAADFGAARSFCGDRERETGFLSFDVAMLKAALVSLSSARIVPIPGLWPTVVADRRCCPVQAAPSPTELRVLASLQAIWSSTLPSGPRRLISRAGLPSAWVEQLRHGS